ncbi:MAG: transporter substrate-binding domain-containing protein [Pontibacterium sp.]
MNSDLNELQRAFAPTGVLRATINIGNPILAGIDSNGAPFGVSVDLAKRLAHELNLPIELMVLKSAGEAVTCVTEQKADFGFFAVDPKRGEGIAFSAPYVHITGSYLVAESSPIHTIDDVDQYGNRVVVGNGSAYDLFLSRSLKRATIERSPTSPTVVDTYIASKADVAAGVTQQLLADMEKYTGQRLIPGHFMTIKQAMGVPKSRSANVQAYLSDFVERMKHHYFVAKSLDQHGIEGAAVAPLESEIGSI